MKKILLLSVAIACAQVLNAQSWAPQDKPQKLEKIIATYEQSNVSKQTEDEDENESFENGEPEKEGKHYHFDRWTWYWQNHLDENGYLASPAHTFEEWQKFSQKQQARKYFKTTNQAQWSFVGPLTTPGGYNGIGRINSIGFHPTDSNTFIVATAGGGAWRTTNGGLTWSSLTDNLPLLGVSDVDYNPLNPNTIYMCTGDRDASDTYSIGVLKSTDGGNTWNTTGLQYNRSDLKLTNCLVINPLDTNSLTLATSAGIMKSYDGGQTWTTKALGNYKQVVYNPADTNIIYATSSAITRSDDGGQTWHNVLIVLGSVRAAVAVTPAAPNIVKAVVADNNNGLAGIYTSSDTGKTFTKVYGFDCTQNILNNSPSLNVNTCDGQGWYDLAIALSPIDSNKIYVGGVNTWESSNGGYNWNIVAQWKASLPGIKVVHADKHFLSFHPLMPDVLFECNDGGIYKSYNPASYLWTDLSNGLGITQFYRLATSDLASFVIAGAQDNGSKKVTFGGASDELTGGDGMDCQIDYSDPTTFYTSSQYGSFSRTNNNGASFTNIRNNIPGQPDGAWITPLVIDAQVSSIIYAGYKHIYISGNQGDTWADISPNLPSVNINRLGVTVNDPNVVYAVQGNSIRYTMDQGTTNWGLVPSGFSGVISDLLVDPANKNHIWVTYSGFGARKVAEYTIGGTWAKFDDSLPNIPVQCITIDTFDRTMYIGTDIGVFYRTPTMTGWEPYTMDLPVIEVTDLSINYTTNEIWASTYGRGIWKSPKFQGVGTAINNVPLAFDVISIAPNPNKGEFSVITTNKALIDQTVNVRIVSFTGATALQTQGRFDASGRLPLNASNLARGTYIVEVTQNGSTLARTKMIVL